MFIIFYCILYCCCYWSEERTWWHPCPSKKNIYHVYILTYIIYNSTHEKLINFFLPYQMPYLYVAKQIWIMHKKKQRKTSNLYQNIAQKKDIWKKKEAYHRTMVAANTADDLSAYLADRYGGGDFILQSKDNLRFGKIDSMTPSWNIFHLIFFSCWYVSI